VKKLQSAALLPSQKDTQTLWASKKGRLAALPARLQPAAGMRASRAPCHTAFLALARRFLIFSQVLSELLK
jgi:hypothetical protein